MNQNKDKSKRHISNLESIMLEYGTDVKRFIYTYVKNWDTASELTQEVFIKVYKNLTYFEHRSSIKTWIFTIAANQAKDYLKSWHYRNLTFNEFLFSKKPAPFDKNPENLAVTNDENQSLLVYLQALPVKYKEVIYLYYYEELTTTEISILLDTSVSTVKTRLLRGKQLLKKRIPFEKDGEINEFF